MRQPPSIAPSLPDDVDESLGRPWCETGEERANWKTVISDLLDGQYSDPVRMVAFNTAEGWSRDVSEEIADESAERCALDGFDVPPFLEKFVEWHRSGRPRQLPLPLRGAA